MLKEESPGLGYFKDKEREILGVSAENLPRGNCKILLTNGKESFIIKA